MSLQVSSPEHRTHSQSSQHQQQAQHLNPSLRSDGRPSRPAPPPPPPRVDSVPSIRRGSTGVVNQSRCAPLNHNYSYDYLYKVSGEVMPDDEPEAHVSDTTCNPRLSSSSSSSASVTGEAKVCLSKTSESPVKLRPKNVTNGSSSYLNDEHESDSKMTSDFQSDFSKHAPHYHHHHYHHQEPPPHQMLRHQTSFDLSYCNTLCGTSESCCGTPACCLCQQHYQGYQQHHHHQHQQKHQHQQRPAAGDDEWRDSKCSSWSGKHYSFSCPQHLCQQLLYSSPILTSCSSSSTSTLITTPTPDVPVSRTTDSSTGQFMSSVQTTRQQQLISTLNPLNPSHPLYPHSSSSSPSLQQSGSEETPHWSSSFNQTETRTGNTVSSASSASSESQQAKHQFVPTPASLINSFNSYNLHDPGKPPLPPKKKSVMEYMQMVGTCYVGPNDTALSMYRKSMQMHHQQLQQQQQQQHHHPSQHLSKKIGGFLHLSAHTLRHVSPDKSFSTFSQPPNHLPAAGQAPQQTTLTNHSLESCLNVSTDSSISTLSKSSSGFESMISRCSSTAPVPQVRHQHQVTDDVVPPPLPSKSLVANQPLVGSKETTTTKTSCHSSTGKLLQSTSITVYEEASCRGTTKSSTSNDSSSNDSPPPPPLPPKTFRKRDKENISMGSENHSSAGVGMTNRSGNDVTSKLPVSCDHNQRQESGKNIAAALMAATAHVSAVADAPIPRNIASTAAIPIKKSSTSSSNSRIVAETKNLLSSLAKGRPTFHDSHEDRLRGEQDPKQQQSSLLHLLDVSQYLVLKSPTEDGPEIKGGTPDALLVKAAEVTKNEFLFQEAFLATFRTFVTPKEVIDKLLLRYNKFIINNNSSNGANTTGTATTTTTPAAPIDAAAQKISRNCFVLLVRVVDDLCITDCTDELMNTLLTFVCQLIQRGDHALAKVLRNKTMEKMEARKAAQETARLLLPSISVSTKVNSLLDFKSLELAEQMTIIDSKLFAKVEVAEALLWAKEQREEVIPNLTRFTEHFNNMSYWVRTRILQAEEQKERERICMKFIKVMRNLKKLSNFNSIFAILSALDSAPIRRLDWPRSISDGMKEFSSLIDSSSSFRAYRQVLADTLPPCIPYIGLILQDLTFVHVGNDDLLPDGNINFSKRWLQFNILDQMRRFRNSHYPLLRKNEEIVNFFNNFEDYLHEESLWQISESIKPRGKK